MTSHQQFQSVSVVLNGRLMREDAQEYFYKTTAISPAFIALETDFQGEIGEKLVCYSEEIGRLEGVISEGAQGAFMVKLTISEYKREKLANQLTYLANKQVLNPIDQRQYLRVVPRFSQAELKFFNGEKYACEVLDISYGGASLKLETRPQIDEYVQLNGQIARVVRQTGEGCAIMFAQTASPAIFNLAAKLGATL